MPARTARGRKGEAVVFRLTFLVKQEGADFTALCLEFDVASCGPTRKEAMESLRGLVALHVADCLAENESPERPVPAAALREFLQPPARRGDLSLTSHQESLLPASYAAA